MQPPLREMRSEGLRSIVLSFIILILELLVEDETFQDLLEGRGSIVTEMVSQLLHQLN